LGRPDVHALPPGQARAITRAAEAASVHSFHVGMMIATLLLAVGGLVGLAGIRNVRGRIAAEDCGPGQLVGAGRGIVERSDCEQPRLLPAPEPAASGAAGRAP
jgi:hypothetical protein